MQGVQGLSQRLSKDNKEERYIEGRPAATLHTMHSQTELEVISGPVGSGYDVSDEDGDDPHWGPRVANG